MPLCISLLLQTLHSVVCTQCYVCLSVCLSVNVCVCWSAQVSLCVPVISRRVWIIGVSGNLESSNSLHLSPTSVLTSSQAQHVPSRSKLEHAA